MAKKQQRLPYAEGKKNARQRIRRMLLYLDASDPDASERAELEAKIKRLALTYGLQTELRKNHTI